MLDNRRAIVDVGLHPGTTHVEGGAPENGVPVISSRPLKGLIDTGAQITCITRSTAIEVGLKPRGKRRLGNVSNIEIHTSYLFALGVWYTVYEAGKLSQTNGYYGFEPILGCDFKDNSDFDVLIGMDVISKGNLSIKRNGEFEWELP